MIRDLMATTLGSNNCGVQWAQSVDGIDVRIFDDTETLAARFLIDASNWNCVLDQLAVLCASKDEARQVTNP